MPIQVIDFETMCESELIRDTDYYSSHQVNSMSNSNQAYLESESNSQFSITYIEPLVGVSISSFLKRPFPEDRNLKSFPLFDI